MGKFRIVGSLSMEKEEMKKDISIVLCGAAGQGIQTIEDLLTKAAKRSGYYVFGTKEYMSRVRGGVNSTSIRISNTPVKAYVDRIDYLIPLNEDAIPHLKSRINPETEIFGERKFFESVEECQNCNFIRNPLCAIGKRSRGCYL